MGTNYYIQREYSGPEGEAIQEKIHIGKNSGGWQFIFRAYKFRNIFSKADWEKYLTRLLPDPDNKDNWCNVVIVDEYGDFFSRNEFWGRINLDKKFKNHYDEGIKEGWLRKGEDDFKDEDGWSMCLREFS